MSIQSARSKNSRTPKDMTTRTLAARREMREMPEMRMQIAFNAEGK
jgi:hypothetical protein